MRSVTHFLINNNRLPLIVWVPSYLSQRSWISWCPAFGFRVAL